MTKRIPIVVVIDDSPASISLYKLSTAPLAVDLRTFQSPVESLDYLSREPADLIFLDIPMRQLDGFTTLKKLRDLDGHAHTNVVMVTSKDYDQDRSTARRLGAREFLVKPLRSQEIREVICKYTDAKVRATQAQRS